MRRTVAMAAIGVLAATAASAQGNPQQLLQGLLNGNQGNDQALHEAFERGYRQGRQDEARFEADRRGPPGRDDYRGGPGYPPPPPPPGYGR